MPAPRQHKAEVATIQEHVKEGDASCRSELLLHGALLHGNFRVYTR